MQADNQDQGDSGYPSEAGDPATVRVSAGETLAVLLHAARTNRRWLSDFADETIVVSQDLYQVLVTYKAFCLQENARAA